MTLSEIEESGEAQPVDVLSIHEALERLAAFDSRKAEIVDFMVFGGLTGKGVVEVMNIPEHVVWREWRVARAWLHQELKSIATP